MPYDSEKKSVMESEYLRKTSKGKQQNQDIN